MQNAARKKLNKLSITCWNANFERKKGSRINVHFCLISASKIYIFELSNHIVSYSSAQMAAMRPQFLLFGDSITQRSFGPGGWAGVVADAYQRQVDVINRGYSGYNSRWALSVVDHIFPANLTGKIELATVFFGANDAALSDRPSSSQHIPLSEYIFNMKSIVAHLRSRDICSIILITPPPVFEPGRIAHVLATYNVQLEAPERTNESAGQYASAVVALGAELGLPVVNLWQEFQKIENWQEELLNDGLHLTPKGNTLVGTLVLDCISTNFTLLHPEKLRFDLPEWSEMASSTDAAATVTAFLQNK
jgi:lysophospholipase L1-like esterase